jgi:hypothetical protein
VALDATGTPGYPPQVAAGAPGTPRAVSPDELEAARGSTRVGVSVGFDF